MAVNGQPISTYRTMVQIQKANGVQLIEGCDSRDKAKDFITHIADAIKCKIANVLSSSVAFSVLSDGSQARKTGSEKELVLVRVAKSGIPTYFMAALQNIDDYGDATANNLKRSIDNTFRELVKVPDIIYNKLLVAATSDGASVNTGSYNGLLVQMQNDDRPWLIKIACISHRVELAIKDSLLKQKAFTDARDLMVTLYYLMKRSGKFQRHLKETAAAYDVQIYKFPKVHGTRFVNHQRNGVKVLLHNWLPLILAIENSLANNSHRMLDSKLRGILKRLTDTAFLSNTCLFKIILDIISKLSLKFEEGQILPFEVAPAVEVAKSELEDLLEDPQCPMTNLRADCAVTIFNTDNIMNNELKVKLPKPGHLQRMAENREYVTLSYDKMKYVGNATGPRSTQINLKKKAVPLVLECLETRMSVFQDGIYKDMLWVDPANWQKDSSAEIEALNKLATHFAITLEHHGFDITNIKSEWKRFKILVNHNYAGMAARELWVKIVQYRKKEYPNVCMMAELVMAIGVSNCTVESCFSYLTAMLSDRRLSMVHETMSNLLLIRANHLVWSESEVEEILDAALVKYFQKRRKLKLSGSGTVGGSGAAEIECDPPSAKKSHVISDESDSESDAESVGRRSTDDDIDSEVEELCQNWDLENTSSVQSESNEVEPV